MNYNGCNVKKSNNNDNGYHFTKNNKKYIDISINTHKFIFENLNSDFTYDDINKLFEQYKHLKELLKRGNEVKLFLEQFSLFKFLNLDINSVGNIHRFCPEISIYSVLDGRLFK